MRQSIVLRCLLGSRISIGLWRGIACGGQDRVVRAQPRHAVYGALEVWMGGVSMSQACSLAVEKGRGRSRWLVRNLPIFLQRGRVRVCKLKELKSSMALCSCSLAGSRRAGTPLVQNVGVAAGRASFAISSHWPREFRPRGIPDLSRYHQMLGGERRFSLPFTMRPRTAPESRDD